MGEPAFKYTLTYDDYLSIAEHGQERLYFWDGAIYAMAGGSENHLVIETNLVGELFAALDGQRCRPSTGNRRLRRLDSANCVFADAVVICGATIHHPGDRNAATNPTVVLEVLSPSSEEFDQGDKLIYYQGFPSMRAIVLVAADVRYIEMWHRADEASAWSKRTIEPRGSLALDAIGVRLPMERIYRGAEIVGAA